MTSQDACRARLSHLPAFGMLAVVLSGCAGGQFGSELSTRPKPRPIDQPEGLTLHLPQDQPFNIVLPRASKEPGLEGTAESDAMAKPSGEALATASVNSGGNAEGAFQLGHALSNGTDRQADFEYSVRFAYEFEAHASAELGTPDALVNLRIYARSDRGRLLRDLALITYSTANGASQQKAGAQVSFTLTLAPGEAVSVFLAGQTRVEVPQPRSAAATLKLHDVQIDVTTRPAPPLRATSDGKP